MLILRERLILTLRILGRSHVLATFRLFRRLLVIGRWLVAFRVLGQLLIVHQPSLSVFSVRGSSAFVAFRHLRRLPILLEAAMLRTAHLPALAEAARLWISLRPVCRGDLFQFSSCLLTDLEYNKKCLKDLTADRVFRTCECSVARADTAERADRKGRTGKEQ